VQSIFNCDEIQSTSLTTDKVLNTLIYKLPYYVVVYTCHKLFKIVCFLVYPV